MNRLGIFGGSFNPVHMGHCAVAEHFVRQVGLDTCMFVPTYISPFKKDEPGVAEPYHRLSMLRSVCRTNARFAVSDVELRRRDVSYTVTTVRHFRERYPKAELFLLIGQDLVPRFDEWRDWEEIVRMATVCVARRSPDVVTGVGDIHGHSDAARADAAML
ncbi:MAG: nicotinate (nicotinamide) nucleotide adenylyltransferase, partial [Candidatus Kapaibacterium sp.]